MSKPETKFKERYKTTSRRLKGFDYSSFGVYFVTICCQHRECFLGSVENGRMALNELGRVVSEEWKRTEVVRENVLVDEFVVMPNHLHGILVIQYPVPPSVKCVPGVETNCNLSLRKAPKQHGTSQTIGSIIRGFKIGVTKYARENTDLYTVWQPNYHDHIIRNECELNRIREYIRQNPQNGAFEKDAPENGFW